MKVSRSTRAIQCWLLGHRENGMPAFRDGGQSACGGAGPTKRQGALEDERSGPLADAPVRHREPPRLQALHPRHTQVSAAVERQHLDDRPAPVHEEVPRPVRWVLSRWLCANTARPSNGSTVLCATPKRSAPSASPKALRSDCHPQSPINSTCSPLCCEQAPFATPIHASHDNVAKGQLLRLPDRRIRHPRLRTPP